MSTRVRNGEKTNKLANLNYSFSTFDLIVILTIAIADFLYGIFVSPFFVENYVHTSWNQSEGYCNFYVYLFTFHDLFVPLLLILLSAYISLKFSGETTTTKVFKFALLKEQYGRGQISPAILFVAKQFKFNQVN